jgi:aryl-alcohol dehydrogenase-like predicted oxidoreductase
MAAVLSPERALGATGITVPLIGYGTAPLGKDRISREEAVRCLNHAIDQGITYLELRRTTAASPSWAR